MLCLACDCIAAKMWTRVLPFWTGGASVCQARLCCFQGGYFVLFLTLEPGKPASLSSLISVPASTSSRPWELRVRCVGAGSVHGVGEPGAAAAASGCAESPLVRGFPRWPLQKTSLQTAIRYHEHSLLKGDGEKGDAWGIYPGGSNLAVAVSKRFVYLTEIVHSGYLLTELGIFSSCCRDWRSQGVKELYKTCGFPP